MDIGQLNLKRVPAMAVFGLCCTFVLSKFRDERAFVGVRSVSDLIRLFERGSFSDLSNIYMSGILETRIH
jgi:hypothetical protein